MPIFSIQLFYKFLNRKIHINSIGFTLIELLVGMGIIAFLGTATVAVFGNFNRQQSINIAYDDLQNALAQAKSYALSQVVTSCDIEVNELIGYQVTFNDSDDYVLQEVCKLPSGDEIITDLKSDPTPLPDGISFVFSGINPTTSPIRFFVLSGGAQNDGRVTITNGSTTQDREIYVSESGIIQDAN